MQNFEDRNVDRVSRQRTITEPEVGTQIRFRVSELASDPELAELPPLTQEQLGKSNDNSQMAEQIAEAMRLVNDAQTCSKAARKTRSSEFIHRTTKSDELLLTGLDSLREAAKLEYNRFLSDRASYQKIGNQTAPAPSHPICKRSTGKSLPIMSAWALAAARSRRPCSKQPIQFTSWCLASHLRRCGRFWLVGDWSPAFR